MASDQIASSSTHRALAGAARDTAERIGDLGEIEIMEGQEELEASGEVGGEADELRDEARELATSAGGFHGQQGQGLLITRPTFPAVNAAVADAMDEASARLDSARSVEDVREAVRDAGDRVGAIATAAEEIVAAEDTE